MMSSYQEIIKNWKIAIDSQGFTQEQVEKQLDTISRKYQRLKDQLSGVIMNTGNNGLTMAIKEALDMLNNLIRMLNNVDGAVIKSGLVIGGLTAALYKAHQATKALGAAMIETGVMAGTATNIMNSAFKRNAVTLAITAAVAAITYGLDQLDKFKHAAEIAAEETMKKYAANAEAMKVEEEHTEYVETLANSYVTLKEKINETALDEKKRQELQSDLMFTEGELTRALGEGAMERIKSSENVGAAVKTELGTYKDVQKKKIEAMIRELQYEQSVAFKKRELASQALEGYKADIQAYVNNNKAKMDSDKSYLNFKARFYEILARYEEFELETNKRKRDAWAKEQWKEYKIYTDTDGKYTQEEKNLAKRKMENAEKMVSSLNPLIAAGTKNAEAWRYNERYSDLEDKIKEQESILNGAKQIIGDSQSLLNTFHSDTTLGGDTAYPEEPKKSKGSKGSKSGNSSRHPEYNDAAITGYEGKHKDINQQYTDEISSLKKYAEKYGASEEITMKIDDLYKKQQEENSRATKEYIDHIVQSGNDLYSSRLTTVTTQDVESFINAIAGQESGGDYGAVNSSSGATGKYQIMPDNWAGWASEAGLSSDAPMTPSNQETVARHKLSEYYNAYGADGAAVAWYAGAGNAERWVNGSSTDVWGRSWEAAQNGAPSIAEYVREVASRNTGTVGYSQTLADLGVNEDDWKNANIQGKQTIISNLMKQDGIKDNEQTLKYLDEVNGTLLKGLEKIQGLQQEAITIQENKDKDLYSNSKAEVEQRKLEVSQRNTSQSYSLGLSIRDIDEQRMKLDELKVSYEALNDILPRFTEGTKTYKELLQETQKAQLEWNKQQRAVVESMFSIRSTMNEHEYKMKDMTGDNGGIRKATAELEKDMKDLANLQIKKQKEWYSLNKEEQWKLDEEIKEKADKVKEAMDKYHDTIMSGLESVAEQFFIDNKSLSDIFHDMWTDLGRDAWKMLFGQKVDNPSILGQMIGLGMPDQEEAKRDAATAMMSENNDALAMNTNGITSLNEAIERLIAVMNGTYHDPFSQPTTSWGSQTVGQSLDSFARFNNPSLSNEQRYSFDRFGATGSSYGVNSTHNNDYAFSMANIKSNEKITTAMNNLSNTVRFSDTTTKQDIQAQLKNTNATKLNASNTMQLAVGLAGIGNAFANGDWLGGILGLAQTGIGLGWFGKATGGAFATGGSMSNGVQAAGRIQGAGTGRSDSILAYLANKGKFVMLSNGEYVINEKSAKALGYDTLDNLNAYADGGGLSGSPVNPTPYVPTINQQVAKRAINIHSNNITTEKLLREQNAHMLEQNNLLKNMGQSGGDGRMIVLNTQASSADVLKALQENPRAVQAILGRQNRMGFR